MIGESVGAVELGATEIYVLQVGRIEQPLRAPTKPWEPALVAFNREFQGCC